MPYIIFLFHFDFCLSCHIVAFIFVSQRDLYWRPLVTHVDMMAFPRIQCHMSLIPCVNASTWTYFVSVHQFNKFYFFFGQPPRKMNHLVL